MSTQQSKEQALLEKIQQSLAIAKQLAEQLATRYAPLLADRVNQTDAHKVFTQIFNEISSGKRPNDFFQRLLVLAQESACQKGDPRPIVLPPLNLNAHVDLPTSVSEEELLHEIKQCIDKIRTSVDRLLTMHRKNLLEFVRLRMKFHLDRAEDIVQETYSRAYRKIWTLFYDKHGNPKDRVDHNIFAWLCQIASRAITDRPLKPPIDYPEDEEGNELEILDLKSSTEKKAILGGLAPNLLQILCEQNEPHKVFVFILNQLIGWGPKDIVSKFSGLTLEELFTELRKRLIHCFGGDAKEVDDALAPLRAKLRSHEAKRLRDYFSDDPENDIQNWRRSVAHRTKAYIERHCPEILTPIKTVLKIMMHNPFI